MLEDTNPSNEDNLNLKICFDATDQTKSNFNKETSPSLINFCTVQKKFSNCNMKFQEEFITLFKCFYLNKLINQIYILNLIKICTKFLLFYIPNSTKFTIMI